MNRTFKEITARYDARVKLAQQENSREQDERRRFQTEIVDLIGGVVLPALSKIRDQLINEGWMCNTNRLYRGANGGLVGGILDGGEIRGARFEIYRGDMPNSAAEKPSITFFVEGSKREMSVNSICGLRHFPLSAVTVDFVRTQVVEFFDRLEREQRL
jgi:hypothetical protein